MPKKQATAAKHVPHKRKAPHVPISKRRIPQPPPSEPFPENVASMHKKEANSKIVLEARQTAGMTQRGIKIDDSRTNQKRAANVTQFVQMPAWKRRKTDVKGYDTKNRNSKKFDFKKQQT